MKETALKSVHLHRFESYATDIHLHSRTDSQTLTTNLERCIFALRVKYLWNLAISFVTAYHLILFNLFQTTQSGKRIFSRYV